MNNGNFWIKDGRRSIGGSGAQGWVALAIAALLLYAFVPPFREAVNGLLLIALVVGGAILVVYILANSRRGRW